jgi:hypothetical protein
MKEKLEKSTSTLRHLARVFVLRVYFTFLLHIVVRITRSSGCKLLDTKRKQLTLPKFLNIQMKTKRKISMMLTKSLETKLSMFLVIVV